MTQRIPNTSSPTEVRQAFQRLGTLTDDSMADGMHRHSELSASDGTPSAALSVSADGTFVFTGGGAIQLEDTEAVGQGCIFKGVNRFLHNFSHPTGSTAIPLGGNIFLGMESGNFTVGSGATETYHGSRNIGLGNDTLQSLTTGYNNTALGKSTLFNVTTGAGNVGIGTSVLYAVDEGDDNFAIGKYALLNITDSDSNVAMGVNAGRYIADGTTPFTSGSYNFFMGYGARASADSVSNEVTIGYSAIGHGGGTITLGGSTMTAVYIPNDSQQLVFGAAGTTDYTVEWDGNDAVHTITAGDFVFTGGDITGPNVTSGTDPGHAHTGLDTLTDDSMADALHRHSELSASDGTPNAALSVGATGTFAFTGGGAIQLEDTEAAAQGCIYKGATRFLHNFNHPTGNTQIPEGGNIFLGEGAGNFTVGSGATATYHGSYNIGIGTGALDALTTGYYNLAMGKNAAGATTSGNGNFALGYGALASNSTGSESIVLGKYALLNTTGSDRNIAIGVEAGRHITGGSTNFTAGSYCILMGYKARASANSVVNEVVIGYIATGKGSNTITLGGLTMTTVFLPNDSQKLAFGDAGTTDYTIEWTGSNATHTVTAGDFVFTGGNITGPNVTSGVDPGHTHTGGASDEIARTNNNAGAIVIGQVVYCDDPGDVDLAKADASGTADVIGFVADTSIASSASGDIKLFGVLTATTGQWDTVAGTSGGLAAGTVYYLDESTAGSITSTAPSTPGEFVVRVGIGLSTTELLIFITQAIEL